MDKKVVISTTQGDMIADFLRKYKDDNLKFEYIGKISSLNHEYKVWSDETNELKLELKIKNIIKATSFGGTLFFAVHVEK